MKALFLGAGASYELGLPLVWELTAELRRWLSKEKLHAFNENWKKQGAGHSDEALEQINKLLDDNNLHYESIIGRLENLMQNRDTPNSISKSLDYFRVFFLQAVYGLLLERQSKNGAYLIDGLETFQGIKYLAEHNKPLWIFSLNHDSAIEIFASLFSIPIKSGFNEEIDILMTEKKGFPLHKLRFEFLSRDSIKNGNYSFFNAGEYGINLVKIHGSLDIFGFKDEINYLKVKPESNNPVDYLNQLNFIEKINYGVAIHNRWAIATNENMYLDEKGILQFLRKSILSGEHKFKSHLQIAPKEFLTLFEKNLSYINELICIGYSFGDTHINTIIKLWLESSESSKLSIVDPAAKIQDTFKDLASKIELCQQVTSEFLMNITGTCDIALENKRKKRLLTRDNLKFSLLNPI